jgi:hypothetical protein
VDAELLAIASTIAVGIILTVLICWIIARRTNAGGALPTVLAIIGIITTVVVAVVGRPLEGKWDEILGSPTSATPSPSPTASPTNADCDYKADQEVPTSISLKTTDPQHTQSEVENGRYQLAFEPYLTWAGYLIGLPKGVCNYRLELTAQLLPNSHQMAIGEGWGYGIGPCNVWTADAPRGFVLQYAAYQETPTRVVNNSGWFVSPDVNKGSPVPVSGVDNSEHQWVFNVHDNRVTISRDFGQNIGTYPLAGSEGLPETCRGRDVFIRVFNARAVFKDIKVVAQ